ncbi:helix-turn-helix transcriptional regulator [Nocardioides sp.]|uniref:helix-turn-helix transcriptional regulator n=1 Tax=Nocardioides sp. TaxID=35761 RepID=UPI003D0F5560
MSVATAIMGDVAPPGHLDRDLVGREAELTELTSLLGVRPTRSPDALIPDAVLLSGDAGVGKTRLLTALRDVAVEGGWQVVAGHCLDFGDSALPYLPFSEVIGRLSAERPEVVAEVARAHPALARLQPGRRVMSQDASHDLRALDRGELFTAVHAVLEAVAAAAPLLLVIEDAHWADQSTRDMVSFLFSRPFRGLVAIVVSYRSDDLHRRHPLRTQVAEWSRVRGVERLQLGPLAPDHVRALVLQLHPEPLDQDEVEGIVDRAEGNAFFVEELVGAASGPGRWVPSDLADVLLVRLDRLDDTARQVVRAASVAGRRVTHELLAAATDIEPGALETAVRKAVEMNVLVAQGSAYAFRHALLGEATYDDLLPGERVRLHARYADALRERRGLGTAAELARHARLAMDFDTALEAGIRAGDEAMTVGGPDEASQHYQLALELMADRRRPNDLAVDVSQLAASAASALMASGHPGRAAALVLEQLQRLPTDAPPSWRARLLIARAAALDVIEPDEEPVKVSAEAVALLPDEATKLRAQALALHARMLAHEGRYDEAQGFGLDALELAERLDLGAVASDAVTTLSGLKRSGPKEALRASLALAVQRAQESGAIDTELRGRFHIGRSHQDWAEWDDAARWFRGGVERAEAAGVTWAPYGFEARWQLAWVLHVRGRWEEELALLEVDAHSPPPIGAALLEGLRLQIALARGEDVAARLRPLRALWPAEGLLAITTSPLEIETAGRRGDAAGAVRAYDDAVAVMVRIWHERFSARVRLAAVALGAVADGLARSTTAERAARLLDARRIHADGRAVVESQDSSDPWGPEGRAWVGRLEAEWLRVRWLADTEKPTPDELIDAWRSAVALFDEFGHVHEGARARVGLATVLRATGDAVAARLVADEARETARALGATALLLELRELGAAPARSAQDSAATLTPRELEILTLVAQGHSNGEIGKQLFISTKTVSVHVSNILGKLDAAGRTEAAAIARRRGLIEQ